MACNIWCNRQSSPQKSTDCGHNKTFHAKLSKFIKGNKLGDGDLNKKCSLVNDLKLISTKLTNQHRQQHHSKHYVLLFYISVPSCKSQTHFKRSNNGSVNSADNKCRTRKRPIAPITIMNINYSNAKKSLVNSPSMPSNCLRQNNKISQCLKLIYSTYDSNTHGHQQKETNINNLMASSVLVNQSKLYSKRLKEFKSQNQCQSTTSLQGKVFEVLKCHNLNKGESRDKSNGISPMIRDKMRKHFLLQNKTQSKFKAKAKQFSIEMKEDIKSIPLLWQLKYHRDSSAKNISTFENSHSNPLQTMRNSKLVSSMNNDDNNHIQSLNNERITIVKDNSNDYEANVIVTTMNNQYDNTPSLCRMPFNASKSIFFHLKKEFVATQLTTCFSSPNISNEIIHFLSFIDIIALSFVSKGFNRATKKIRYSIIKSRLFLPHNKYNVHIHDSIWNNLKNYSKLSTDFSLTSAFNLNALKHCVYLPDIKKDIIRTFPNDPTFGANSPLYNQLLVILTAYANYNPRIGYAQGMNFIAGKILHRCKDIEQTFLVLDAILTRLQMEEIIGVSNKITKIMDSIGRLIQKNVPRFNQFLNENMLTHELCTVNWVLTLFSNSISNEELYTVWEFIFVFGWEFINYFILAIIGTFQDTITEFSFDNFSDCMKQLLYADSFKRQFKQIIDLCFQYMNLNVE